MNRFLEQVTDARERELRAAVWTAGNVLDAVNDGSGEMPPWQADRNYDAAKTALSAYLGR